MLIDDRRVLACLTLAIAAQNKEITTVQGLDNGDALSPLQRAFIERDASQYGVFEVDEPAQLGRLA